ncbi:ribosome biogenesis GTPase YlqF [Paenibacillus antri]|uniref:Ribosome biogenesis GTPase A n=1 Tax=Paenibacillus antri TaxID=2582848 RepID=A0A5R9G904_9BACL|nr:ribosome biogenesis GTPase YlqF [Paenibacillus antri]TLS49868.1 ribosome biogenesis GTPase YlqF [Paenibacillus antri]
MTIQWFPGHMTRARRQIEEKLKLIDVAIELLDARLPASSRNPMIGDILGQKPRLVLLNKSDLADPAATERWVEKLAADQVRVLPIDASTGTGVRDILPRAKELMAPKYEAWRKKGMEPRPIRTLIVGIPNVGKSTLINRLAGRAVAATGDRPGVTKGQQWIKFGKEMDLLDTPGILWPKFEDPQVGFRLAATGAIRDEILNSEDVAFFTAKFLCKRYPGVFQERYGIETLPEDLEDPNQVVELLEAIGRRRGAVMSGGKINLAKASDVFLHDLRSGKLGRITLELPGLV